MTDIDFAPGDRVQIILFNNPTNGTVVHVHNDPLVFPLCISVDRYKLNARETNCIGYFKRLPHQVTLLEPARPRPVTTERAW